MRRLSRAAAVRVLGGAAVAPVLGAPAFAQSALPTVRVALIPIEPSCLVYYAQENGDFQRAGISVDVTENPASPAIASAVAAGSYDIGYATVSTLADAHAKGLPFVIIAPDGLIKPGVAVGAIVVAPQSTIRTAKDFDGKTCGVSGLNTLSEYVPRAWVDKHGGDATTIRFIEMPFPQLAPALTAGRIDAAYLVEPFLSLAVKGGTARILTTGDDAIASTYLASAWFATAPWAKAHPQLVSAFAGAIEAAARWANAESDRRRADHP